MATIAGREWYAAALILGIGANAAMALSQHDAGRGLMAGARAAAFPAQRVQLRECAYRHAHRSDALRSASVGLAFAMILCWILTCGDRKRGLHGVLVGLVATYGINFFIII